VFDASWAVFCSRIPRVRFLSTGLLLVCLSVPATAAAQDNYEIQVYGAELVPRAATMVELHSNFTASGRREAVDGVNATNHAVHETLEITHGFSEWFECGFYLFTSARAGNGVDVVGSHVRPRFAVPARYHWPVGVSLSQEFGYVRREFADATSTWEIRPIVDQTIGRLYWSFNPALEKAFNGPPEGRSFEFAPNAMVTYDLTKKVNVGLEYYGGFGPLSELQPWREGAQQLFPAINLDFGPDWEFNAGVGIGLTDPAEPLIFKVIVGRRFGRPPAGRGITGG
jgi:hypothetical protein